MDNKKQPEGLDIHNLQKAQECEQDYQFYLEKCQKFWREKDLTRNTMLVSGGLALIFIFYDDPVSEFIYGIAGVIALFTGWFCWLNRTNEPIIFEQEMLTKCLNKKDEYLKEVNCDYEWRGNRVYVYLKDGRRIEVDEY